MKTNKDDDDENQLIIYTIILNINDSFWTSVFGTNRQKSIRIMTEIARLGGTERVYEETSSLELENTFIKIAKTITPKFGLKVK